MTSLSTADRELLRERGAVVFILGLVFLYLAFVIEALLRGAGGLPHVVSAVFIAYAAVCFSAGFLCLLDAPLGNRVTGLAFALGALMVGASAARALAVNPGTGSMVAAAVSLPAVVLLAGQGQALLRGQLRPHLEDPVMRIMHRPFEAMGRAMRSE